MASNRDSATSPRRNLGFRGRGNGGHSEQRAAVAVAVAERRGVQPLGTSDDLVRYYPEEDL